MPQGPKKPLPKTLTGVLLGGLLLQNVLWFAPASLLPVIRQQLSLSLSQGGLLISIVCLLGALVGPFSGYFIRRFGIGHCFTLSLLLVCLGSVGTVLAGGFAAMLACRFLFGAGFGLALSLAASAFTAWFSPKQRPFLNALYAVLPYIASAANFLLSVKFFYAAGENWRLTLCLPGLLGLGLLALWLALCRFRHTRLPAESGPGKLPYKALMRDILKDRQAKLICLADICDMWGFQFLSSFLPTFLYEQGRRSLDEASSLTSLFPIIGIAAGLFFGFLMGKSGKRKIFTWPMHLCIFAGTLLIAFGGGPLQIVGILLAGLGNAGWAPALYTMPMEFTGMNPARVATLFSVMLSLGFLAAFLSPIIGGWLAGYIGLRYTLLAFSFFALLAAIATLAMKETAPGGGGQTPKAAGGAAQ